MRDHFDQIMRDYSESMSNAMAEVIFNHFEEMRSGSYREQVPRVIHTLRGEVDPVAITGYKLDPSTQTVIISKRKEDGRDSLDICRVKAGDEV